MADNKRRSPLFIAYLVSMLLLLLLGLFLVIYGSLNNVVPKPTLTGPGLYARVMFPCLR